MEAFTNKRRVGKTKGLRKNKPFILLFCVMLALFLNLGSTGAWFTATDARTNSFTGDPRKDFNIGVVDVFDSDPPTSNLVWVKRVGAINYAKKAGFVRLLVMPAFLAADGETILPAEFGVHVLIEDLNTADWMAGGDGYYYYKHILEPGESTDEMSPKKNLFNAVSISDALGDEYDGAHLKIEVKCEAVGIRKWDYRMGWWGSVNTPTALGLSAVDALLAPLTQ
jgi:hypothetical protein